MDNKRFRDKSWYDTFWSSKPQAFGSANSEVCNMITDIRDQLHSQGVNRPRAIDIASGNGRYLPLLVSLEG